MRAKPAHKAQLLFIFWANAHCQIMNPHDMPPLIKQCGNIAQWQWWCDNLVCDDWERDDRDLH
jgi:hypothetical protein